MLVVTGYNVDTLKYFAFQIRLYTMRERLKRSSLFSTFKKKLDIFNWKAKEIPEEPKLLSVNKDILQPINNDNSTLLR